MKRKAQERKWLRSGKGAAFEPSSHSVALLLFPNSTTYDDTNYCVRYIKTLLSPVTSTPRVNPATSETSLAIRLYRPEIEPTERL
jgi:hypothetical protein